MVNPVGQALRMSDRFRVGSALASPHVPSPFTHYCTTTRRGGFQLGRKPMSKRVNRTLKRIDGVLRWRWNDDIWVVGRWLGRVVNGWLNYYAVPGSGRFIRGFVRRLLRM